MTNTMKSYSVEGHGAGILSRATATTRERAWLEAKLYMVDGFHTVKVYLEGVLVFRAFRQVDGSWIDAKTTKTVKEAGVACAALALGCKVRGNYHGTEITGTIAAFDGSGFMHVELDAAVEIYGSVRDSLCFSPGERYLLEVTARAPEGLEIGHLPHDCVCGSFVKKAVA